MSHGSSARIALIALCCLAEGGAVFTQQPPPTNNPCWTTCSRLYDRWQDTDKTAAKAANEATAAEQAAATAKGTKDEARAAWLASTAKARATRRRLENEAARDVYYQCGARCAANAGGAATLAELPGNVVQGVAGLPTSKVPPQTIGLLLPADIRPGEAFSGIVIADVHLYDGVPGVRVIPVQAPARLDEEKQVIVESVAIQTTDGLWPASTVFSGRVADAGAPFTLTLFGTEPAADPTTVEVKLAPSEPRPVSATPTIVEVPWTCSPGTLSIVRGVFDGLAGTTSVSMSGTKATLIAESPRTTFWIAPPDAVPGAHELTIAEGSVSITRPIAAVRLVMSADDLELRKGQKTNFRVAIEGLGGLPPKAWRGGFIPELGERATIARIAPKLTVPGFEDPGLVLLYVENMSRDTVTIEKSDHETLLFVIDRAGVPATGTFDYRGVLKSKKSGRFSISGMVMPLLAPTSGPDAR